jgi:catechol 2,3-dioxygenase-like lactoylglutathione lyase family enzyme
MASFKGVHHGGIGVSDIERSLKFYSECLGFSDVLFDYTGPLPGMERVTGWPQTTARVVFIGNPQRDPLGLGKLKLVQLLAPQGPAPIPEGFRWGELGVSEVSILCHGAELVMEELKRKGCREIMPVESFLVPPFNHESAAGYVEDPDGTKVELVEYRGMCPMLHPGPQIAGLNHVAFGTSDMTRIWEFYEPLGFTALCYEYWGIVDSMNPWFEEPIEQYLMMKHCYPGAGIEPVEHPGDNRDCRGTWGHLGAFEFGIEVTNINTACAHLQETGVEMLSPPQTVAVDSGEWKYAYFVDPDNLYVSLIEDRF